MKNAKDSLVHGVEETVKMPKICKTAVTKNAKNFTGQWSWKKGQKLTGLQSQKNAKISQVSGHKKGRRLTGLQSRKNAKNSQVCGQKKRLSKCRKLTGPWSQKMSTCSRSTVVKKKKKNSQVRSHKRCKKNLQVRSHEKWKKSHRSAVTKNEKLA